MVLRLRQALWLLDLPYKDDVEFFHYYKTMKGQRAPVIVRQIVELLYPHAWLSGATATWLLRRLLAEVFANDPNGPSTLSGKL
jgi:hypothetical protein